ncbi:MAG: EAL domain-containing protein, partial [Phenylobacterium sp.]
MRQFTSVALSATYLCLALIVALLLWRNGGGWAAGVAALVGGLGLCFAVHGLIGQSLKLRALRKELDAVREAQRVMLSQMEQVDARMTEVADAVSDDAGRSEALEGEVHMLEDLVQRMGQRLEERVSASALHTRHEPSLRRHQSAALLDTVREALAENRVDLYLQPVVGLPQRRTIFYESYSRLRDATGRVMMPAEYLAVAEPEGLVTSIDNLLLFR